MPFMKRQVAGSTFNRKGTSTVEPNMAKRCCSERGMGGGGGSRSSTSMILLLIRFSFLIVTGKWGDQTSGGGALGFLHFDSSLEDRKGWKRAHCESRKKGGFRETKEPPSFA